MARRVKKTDSREVDHWVSTDDGRHLPIDKDGNIIFGGSSKKSTSKSKTISSKSSKKDTSKSDSSKKKVIDEDKIYEIADRYNSSTPVSGDWNTELDHEIATIQKEFGLSKSEAKDAMKKYLGFTDDDFADDEPASSSKSKDPLERKRSDALDKISKMKDLDDYDREDIEYLYKDTGGAWIHSDAMERAIEAPLSGKKTATEKSLRRNFDNMMRDWEDVAYTTGSKEAKKFLENEMKDYKNRFEANMKQWSDGNKANSTSKLSKKKQEFVDSLKDKSNSELESMKFNTGGLYTKKDLSYVQAELDSRKKSTSTAQKWDKDVQNWYNAEMRKARADGASVDTMVGIEANLRDQANRRMRDRKSAGSAPKPTRKPASSKSNKLKDIFKGEKSSMVEWKINRAYDKTSLKELALEAGVPSSKVRTMSADELRSMLLSMWKGK